MSAAIFHRNFGDQIEMIMFLKNVSMRVAFCCLTQLAGAHSVSTSAPCRNNGCKPKQRDSLADAMRRPGRRCWQPHDP